MLIFILIGFILGLMVAVEMAKIASYKELNSYEEETKDKGEWPDEY